MAENEQKRTVEAKRAMIEALKKTMGIVTPALEMAKVGRTAHYGWLKDDPDYKAEVDEANEIALDFGETQLHSLMKGILVQGKEDIYERPPDNSSVIFFNKTRNKKRGYVERQEIAPVDPDGNALQPIININVVQPTKPPDEAKEWLGNKESH